MDSTDVVQLTQMDDRLSQFFILIGDLCQGASLAGLDVEIVTADQTRAQGVPGSLRQAASDDEVDDSGYARTLRVGDRLVNLDDIVTCTVRAPENPAS